MFSVHSSFDWATTYGNFDGRGFYISILGYKGKSEKILPIHLLES